MAASLLTSGKPPIPALTGLRFIAAFSVLLAHSMHWLAAFSHDTYLIRLLGNSSGIGMPLFFVLSGFVIHYNYSHYFNSVSLVAFVRFMIARFARLYPLYIALLMVFFLQKHTEPWHVPYIFRYLTLTQAWQLLYSGSTWVGHLYLAPAWSISIEWFLYIFYALVGVYLLRFKTIYRCLAAFAVFTIIYYLAAILLFPHIEALNEWTILTYAADVKPQSALMGWLFNTGPIGRFFEFSMGMLAAQIFLLQQHLALSSKQQKMINWLLYIALTAIAFLFINPLESAFIDFGRFTAALMSPFLAIVLFACARNASWFSRLVGCSIMVMLGEASYSMYLLHALFLPSFNIGTLDKPTFYWLFVVIAAMSGIIVASLITYRFYEKPAQRILRNNLGKLWQYCISLRWQPLQISQYSLSKLIAISAATMFTVFFLFANRPDLSPPIQIVKANYGENCDKLAVKEKAFANRFHVSNATLGARQLCLHKGPRCSYNVELDHIGGDPVPGCAKDYSIVYRCNNNGPARSIYLPGEAYGKLVNLACR